MPQHFVFLVLIRFDCEDIVRKRYVIATENDRAREYAIDNWPTAVIEDVEYIDVAHMTT